MARFRGRRLPDDRSRDAVYVPPGAPRHRRPRAPVPWRAADWDISMKMHFSKNAFSKNAFFENAAKPNIGRACGRDWGRPGRAGQPRDGRRAEAVVHGAHARRAVFMSRG